MQKSLKPTNEQANMINEIVKTVIRRRRVQTPKPKPHKKSDMASDYTELDIDNLINTNRYINETTKQKKEDPHSFCKLLKEMNINPSQCENIKIGICMQNLFIDMGLLNRHGWERLDSPYSNKKNSKKDDEHEIDIGFINKATKTIFYLEQKNNINLDTEKSKSTVDKVSKVKVLLGARYPDYTINGGDFGRPLFEQRRRACEKDYRDKI
jgi:hypothetical protein